MKITKTYISLFAILIAVNACSTAGVKEKTNTSAGTDVVSNQITVNPSRSYEECMELKPGRIMRYSFSSDKPVEFNVHYHAEDGIHYPVLEKGINKSEGMVDPEKHHYHMKEQEFYCLMWDNHNHESVNISFTYFIKNK